MPSRACTLDMCTGIEDDPDICGIMGFGVECVYKHSFVVGLQMLDGDGIPHAATYGLDDGVNAVCTVYAGLALSEYSQIGPVGYQYLAFLRHIICISCISMR